MRPCKPLGDNSWLRTGPAFMKNSVQKLQYQKLTCVQCGQTYHSPRELAGHIRSQHADTLPSRTGAAESEAGGEGQQGAGVSGGAERRRAGTSAEGSGRAEATPPP